MLLPDQPKLVAENKVLNQIPQLQRKKIIEDISGLVRETFFQSGKKITSTNEMPSLQRVEKLYESYLANLRQLKYKNSEELLGFVLSLAITIPEPFLPVELARSKMPFTETMIKEKLSPNYAAIFVMVKELLNEMVLQGWMEEAVAGECFVSAVVNFMTSGSQYKRCGQHLGKILKAGLSRPPTAVKDTSFDISRVVTPDRVVTRGFSVLKASSGVGRVSVDSGIDNFKEVMDEDL